MRIYRRLPIIQSGIAARCRKLWLIAASTLASAFLGVSEPALAQTFGTNGNPYPAGISVSSNQTPIIVTLAPGVQVITSVPLAVNLTSTTTAGTGLPSLRTPLPGVEAASNARLAFTRTARGW